jgi:hypothetical protein
MMFTRTFVLASVSCDSTCVSPSTANLETAYAPQYARPRLPTPLDVNNTDASGAARKFGSRCCVSTNAAVTFTCITRMNIGTSYCSIGVNAPSNAALCSRPSSRP